MIEKGKKKYFASNGIASEDYILSIYLEEISGSILLTGTKLTQYAIGSTFKSKKKFNQEGKWPCQYLF